MIAAKSKPENPNETMSLTGRLKALEALLQFDKARIRILIAERKELRYTYADLEAELRPHDLEESFPYYAPETGT